MKTDEFKTQIYQLLSNIPPGKVTSYGRLARMAGHPGRARMVGSLLKQLPAGSTLPWFRVLTASGKPAFAPGTESFERQRALLAREGVTFSASHKVSAEHWWQQA
ncbi:MGMT family protein [Simiduia sp. 21SJ11W-1]|uniref:MGMT family protein n=1 Tax=Simiduia sp. 21SJ11W-1 TaxID=2909669 RepID=UPI00209F5174|nr:MGMT family protein [Simiduia sp. 21SJ11W-1]UTA48898.1 MGMT family protein [Simiduia sp. 21SJ11W-1]